SERKIPRRAQKPSSSGSVSRKAALPSRGCRGPIRMGDSDSSIAVASRIRRRKVPARMLSPGRTQSTRCLGVQQSVQPELAADRAHLGWLDQLTVRHPHGMQWAFKLVTPKSKKLFENRK